MAKAKLAHEKRTNDGQSDLITFSVKKVLEIVDYPGDSKSAVVELDSEQNLGLVPSVFASREAGVLIPSILACPAVYDKEAKLRAVELYNEYQKTALGANNELQQ